MSNFTFTRIMCVALASTIITTVDIDFAEAKRKTLLEQWFPKAAQRLKNQRRQKLIDEERPAAKPIKKVSGPSYYTYKTERLQTLALAGALPVLAPEVVIQKVESKPVTPVLPSTELLGEDDWADPVVIDPSSTGSTNSANIYKGIVTPAHAITNEMAEGISLKIEKGIADVVKAHYEKDPSFMWVDRDWKINEQAKAVLSTLNNAAEVGLDPDEYRVDGVALEMASKASLQKRATEFELALSAAALRYGADAKDGRINPNGISGYHDFPKYKRDYKEIAREIFDSENPGVKLAGLNPDNPRFAMLMAELAELRGSVDEDAPEPIAAGTFFKPGQENGELPKVIALIEKKATPEFRTAHSTVFAGYDGSHLFSDDLVALVKDFQKESGLGADGIVGKNTIAKLQTVSPRAKIQKIELAMERLRWLPRHFGARHVFINEPAYRASYMVNGKTQLSMRAIVGKPSNQTSFFYDTIELVEVNPYWNIPRSILVNEMLGKIRNDPGYLAARNYEVVSYNGKPQDPYGVDWYSDSGINKVYVRQKPGARNALGELKILFPNKHAIYMHDTPARNLFSRSRRALSHGCIRLHKPRDMAAAVLQTSVGNVSSYVDSGKNQTIKVKNKLPVYISYFTAWPNDNGKVGFFADIYGRDKALKKALKRNSDMRDGSSLSSS